MHLIFSGKWAGSRHGGVRAFVCFSCSLTPMGVRALDATIRENWTVHWPFFGIFHFTCKFLLSPQIANGAQHTCQNSSTPPHLTHFFFFYHLYNKLLKFRQLAQSVSNNSNLRLNKRIQRRFCIAHDVKICRAEAKSEMLWSLNSFI